MPAGGGGVGFWLEPETPGVVAQAAAESAASMMAAMLTEDPDFDDALLGDDWIDEVISDCERDYGPVVSPSPSAASEAADTLDELSAFLFTMPLPPAHSQINAQVNTQTPPVITLTCPAASEPQPPVMVVTGTLVVDFTPFLPQASVTKTQVPSLHVPTIESSSYLPPRKPALSKVDAAAQYRRVVAIPRYLNKRMRRVWKHSLMHPSRSAAAHRRPRNGGQFGPVNAKFVCATDLRTTHAQSKQEVAFS